MEVSDWTLKTLWPIKKSFLRLEVKTKPWWQDHTRWKGLKCQKVLEVQFVQGHVCCAFGKMWMINDLNQQVLHQQQHPHDAEMERRLSLQQQSQHQVSQLSNGGGGYQQLHTVHSSPNMLQTAVNSISQQPQPHSAPIVVQSPPGSMTNIFKTLRTPYLAVRNTQLTSNQYPKRIYHRNDSSL